MTSPTPRTSAASASTPIAAPVAARACRQSWAVTAATAPNTIDTPVTPRHIAAVSTTPKPVEAIASVMVTASIALTPPTRISAAPVRAYRPTTEDSTNSAAPLSSSARVCRITVRIDRIEAAMIRVSISSFAIIDAQIGFIAAEHGARQDHSGGCLHQVDARGPRASSG